MKNFRVLTIKDTIKDSKLGEDFEGKTLVLSANALAEDYKHGENQLWGGAGGFGCNPTALGTAVFATCLYDKESTRWSRGDFLGVAKPEVIEEFNAWKAENDAAKEDGMTVFFDELKGLAHEFPLVTVTEFGNDLESALKLVGKVFDADVRYMKKHTPTHTDAIKETQIGKERINFLLDTLDFDRLNKKGEQA